MHCPTYEYPFQPGQRQPGTCEIVRLKISINPKANIKVIHSFLGQDVSFFHFSCIQSKLFASCLHVAPSSREEWGR